jgi:hypothetical protein
MRPSCGGEAGRRRRGGEGRRPTTRQWEEEVSDEVVMCRGSETEMPWQEEGATATPWWGDQAAGITEAGAATWCRPAGASRHTPTCTEWQEVWRGGAVNALEVRGGEEGDASLWRDGLLVEKQETCHCAAPRVERGCAMTIWAKEN